MIYERFENTQEIDVGDMIIFNTEIRLDVVAAAGYLSLSKLLHCQLILNIRLERGSFVYDVTHPHNTRSTVTDLHLHAMLNQNLITIQKPSCK